MRDRITLTAGLKATGYVALAVVAVIILTLYSQSVLSAVISVLVVSAGLLLARWLWDRRMGLL